MNAMHRYSLFAAALAAIFLVGSAQQSTGGAGEKDKSPPPVEQAPDADGAIPDELVDPGFSRYVDMALFARAIQNVDAALMVDIALQVAEGERILMRTHKSGVTARAIAGKAIAFAIEKRDKQSLQRLAAWAERSNDKEIQAQAQAAQKLAGGTRKLTPMIQLSPEMSVDEILNVKELYELIHSSRQIGDAELLRNTEEHIKELKELKPAHRDALVKEVQQALKDLPKEVDPETAALQKLASASRGIHFQGIHTHWESPKPSVSRFTDPETPPQRMRDGIIKITNPSNYKVVYTLHGKTYTLNKDYWYRHSISYPQGSTPPTVRISQIPAVGGYLTYPTSLGGNYEFRVNTQRQIRMYSR